jgi:adenylate cyclase
MGELRESSEIAPKSTNSTGHIAVFGGVRFNKHSGELQHEDKVARLTPKAAAVLIALLDQAPALVSKEELLQRVWGGRSVGDEVLTTCIQELRRALDDDARNPRFIETRHRRGYRFVAPVAPSAVSVSDKPSLAILPFHNLSPHPEQEYFADGLVEDLTAALSRIPSIIVMDRGSSFTFKGKSVRAQQVGRELGVRYIVEGSVRRAGDQLRLTVQLIDAGSGRHLWAEHYDSDMTDVFPVQDKIVENIAGALHPKIWWVEVDRARLKRPENLQAYDYVLRGYPGFRALDDPDHAYATEMFHKALDLEPDYALAMSLAAWCHAQRFSRMMDGDPEAHRRQALEFARNALSLEPDDPRVLAGSGSALWMAGTDKDLDHCLHLFNRAVVLDPYSAEAWRRLGFVQVSRSQPEAAIKAFEHSLRMSPIHPMSPYSLWGVGKAHFVAGRLVEAASWFRSALAERPRDTAFRRRLCATLALLGEIEEARSLALGLLADCPGIGIERMAAVSNMQPEPTKRYAEGLRKAGFPP